MRVLSPEFIFERSVFQEILEQGGFTNTPWSIYEKYLAVLDVTFKRFISADKHACTIHQLLVFVKKQGVQLLVLGKFRGIPVYG